ncbi:acetyl-CoA carboxylase biotin carboxyl carrier protein [Salinibacter ruber]|uniref:acetyl-CoA carboxylase biotin carboxyl carrier protein n=1 Tax=Salinibacter ruber TaxID=146919 RepID=UPI0021685341|nr:acetyl-CoA carboxylase biotin carboxyl carrier protein [Salinibacter ruber]MCS3631903.1 acetyl-CoA carboxylase biotin carboxyl carrier protein [Salinibacter ruber]
MELSKIQELLRLVAESGVSEVEIEEDDFKLTIRQDSPQQVLMQPAAQPAQMQYGPPRQPQYPPQAPPQQAPPQQAPQPQQQPSHAPASSPPPASGGAQAANEAGPDDTSTAPAPDATENGTAEAEETDAAAEEHVVKAPIVGTFYRAPSPDDPPFVEVGDEVQEGDVLCIIEAMKLMNEIECETSGTVKEILVEDAEPVEFDQPLFVLDEG